MKRTEEWQARENPDSETSDSARIYMFDGQEVFIRCQQTLMYQSLARSLVMVAAFLALTGTKSAISTFHTKDGSGSSPPSSSSSTSLNLFKNNSSSPKAYWSSKVEKQADSLSFPWNEKLR